jgi:hypothetical protein
MTEVLHLVERDVFQNWCQGLCAQSQRCIRVSGNYFEGSLYNMQVLPQNCNPNQ